MVSQNDNPKESRPPTLEDLVELCRQLNKKNAKYVVIGGMAIVHHGFVRATEDIDLLIETSLQNEKAVIEALSKLPDSAASELQPGEIDKKPERREPVQAQARGMSVECSPVMPRGDRRTQPNPAILAFPPLYKHHLAAQRNLCSLAQLLSLDRFYHPKRD